MKIIVWLWFPLVLALTIGCHPKSTTGGTATSSDSLLPTGGVKPLPGPKDTTTLPTGGVKPLPGPSAGDVQARLVQQYLRGEINQCEHNGKVVYSCALNAPDAGSEIYDAAGNRIGRCYPSTGAIDPICREINGCKTIYRMAKNIWGKPEVQWVRPN